MADIDVRSVTPAEIAPGMGALVQRSQENKYSLQVALQDLDFDMDEERAVQLGVTLPFGSVDGAEQALRQRVITPSLFVEADGTEHQVAVFDSAPVGFSGFRNCVIHSLSLTDQGLFDVGRFPAVHPDTVDRSWQWFLHRRLATSAQVDSHQRSPRQLIDVVYETLTGLPRPSTDETGGP